MTLTGEELGLLRDFGPAGLIGALWIGERFMSRRREMQLDQTHEALKKKDEKLEALITLISRNTKAIEHFAETQAGLKEVLVRIEGRLEGR